MQIVADDILKLILFFRENKTWHFMWIVREADNSNEMSLFFLKKKYFKVVSGAVAISA